MAVQSSRCAPLRRVVGDWRAVGEAPPPPGGGCAHADLRGVRHVVGAHRGGRNSRPLCPIHDDPDDLEALTPGYFLIGRPILAPPEPELEGIPEGRLNRWQLLQRMFEHLWTRWSREYLQQLQTQTKWSEP